MTNVWGATSTTDDVLSGIDLHGKRVLITGVSAGIGIETFDSAYQTLYGEGSNRLHPLTVPRIMPNAPASHVSIEFGLRGPCFATASACASAAYCSAVHACLHGSMHFFISP